MSNKINYTLWLSGCVCYAFNLQMLQRFLYYFIAVVLTRFIFTRCLLVKCVFDIVKNKTFLKTFICLYMCIIRVNAHILIQCLLHSRTEWLEQFDKRNLVALSASPLLIYPIRYTSDDGYVSDTEDSVTVATEDTITGPNDIKEDLWHTFRAIIIIIILKSNTEQSKSVTIL